MTQEEEIRFFQIRYAAEQILGDYDWRDYATVDIKKGSCIIEYPNMPIDSDPEVTEAIAAEMNYRAWKSLQEAARFINMTIRGK